MPRLLIIAGSGRSLASSARRAGWDPVVIDGFGDHDTRSMAEVHVCDLIDFAVAAASIADQLEPMPWIYGGGLENEPEIIEAIARRHPLRGVAPASLRLVRDPSALRSVLVTSNIAHPEPGTLGRLDPAKRWIAKPIKSVGGLGVELVDAGSSLSTETHQIQEFLDGPRLGGLYLARAEGVELVGITRPTCWIERSISPFLYRGTLGPVTVAPLWEHEIRRIGDIVATEFRLNGLFGIDFVIQDAVPHIIEVNPRPTASVEILELATGRSLLAEHLGCFGERGSNPIETDRPGPARRQAQKVVVYAERAMRVNADWSPFTPGADPWEVSELVDLPMPGTLIEPGQPVFSMLVAGPNVKRCDLGRVWKRHRGLLELWSTSQSETERNEPCRPSQDE